MMNTKFLKQLQANQIEVRIVLELKNGSTMRKAQCPRPIKESTNQHEIQVINRSLNILKHVSVPFLPYQPHQAHQHQIPYIGVMYGI